MKTRIFTLVGALIITAVGWFNASLIEGENFLFFLQMPGWFAANAFFYEARHSTLATAGVKTAYWAINLLFWIMILTAGRHAVNGVRRHFEKGQGQSSGGRTLD